MLRKRCHGRRIKQEIQKLTAIRTPSPRLNPVRESPGSPTRPTPLTSLSPLPPPFFYWRNLPPTSHFPFTYQITKFPLSTNSLATGPSAAAYYSRAPAPAPEPEPNTRFEDPNLNVESLRERSDDRRENGGGRRRTLPGERVLLFTCVSEDGKCSVYLVWTKHNSQELCKEEERTLCIKPVSRYVREWHDCPPGTLEWLKRNLKVVNKLEVCPGDMYDVAMEEIMKYGGKVMPLSEQVADNPEVYLGWRFRVAYEATMKYCVGFMMHHFPLQVANKPVVYLGRGFCVAYEAAMKYGVRFMMRHFPLQVANKPVVYLGRGFRVAYEEAMKYGAVFMWRHFPLQVALCRKGPLYTKTDLLKASLVTEVAPGTMGAMYGMAVPWRKLGPPSRCSRLWRLCLLQLLEWIQSGIYFGRKK